MVSSRPFWIRLAALAGAGVLLLFVFNLALMPLWTRHGTSVAVPEVRQLSAGDAERVLERAGLRAEVQPQPYNPNLPPDIVVDQNPLPNATVKPGRRIYYYVNERPRERVRVPDVTSRSEGVARADLEEAGLLIGQVQMDSVHTPYEGTVTRQSPASGLQLPVGSRVALWLSPGIGRNRATVPDVTGLTPAEARRIVREAGLWVDSPNARGDVVQWQEPQPGTRLRQGEEIRIHTTAPPSRLQAEAPERAREAQRPAPRSTPRESPREPTATAAPAAQPTHTPIAPTPRASEPETPAGAPEPDPPAASEGGD